MRRAPSLWKERFLWQWVLFRTSWNLKLLVMYIISRAAAPITFLQLYEIALCDAGVDYFSLNQAVQHLVKTGNLHQEGELFSPTEKGRRNSEIRQIPACPTPSVPGAMKIWWP